MLPRLPSPRVDRKRPETEFRSKAEPSDSTTRNRVLTEHPEETVEDEEEDVVEDEVETEEDEVRFFPSSFVVEFRC